MNVEQWAEMNDMVVHRRFDDGTVAGIIPLLTGTWRMVISQEFSVTVDHAY